MFFPHKEGHMLHPLFMRKGLFEYFDRISSHTPLYMSVNGNILTFGKFNFAVKEMVIVEIHQTQHGG
jgi:hypothetical protein